MQNELSPLQIQALIKYLENQTYSKTYGTDGDYLLLDELKQYLPAFINKLIAMK